MSQLTKLSVQLCIFGVALFCAVSTTSAQLAVEPSEQHAILKRDVGTWKAKGTIFAADAPEPIKFEGKEVNRMLGELWLVSHFEAELMGEKFTGLSTLGYDPKKDQFVGSWVDSTNPHASHLVGAYDAENKTMTFELRSIDPQTGEPVEERSKVEYEGEDRRVFTMYSIDAAGDLTKNMQIIYTRID